MRSAALALFSPRFLSFFRDPRTGCGKMSGDRPSTSRPSHSVTLSPFTPDERTPSILHAASPPRPASSQPLRQPRAAHSHLHRDGSLPRDCRRLRLRRPLASPCSRDRRKDRQTGGRNDARGDEEEDGAQVGEHFSTREKNGRRRGGFGEGGQGMRSSDRGGGG